MGTEQSQLEASQPVREAINDRGLFTVGWFGVREKHRSRLKIYDRLRTSEHAVCSEARPKICIAMSRRRCHGFTGS